MVARIWWSRTGADCGLPWRIEYPDGRIERTSAVRIFGKSRTVNSEEGFELPDGPKGIIEVTDGFVEAD
jgi:hypothetical protein